MVALKKNNEKHEGMDYIPMHQEIKKWHLPVDAGDFDELVMNRLKDGKQQEHHSEGE